jgi:HK97 family phage portal protein
VYLEAMYEDAERGRLALTARYRAAADASPGTSLLAGGQRGSLQGVLGRDQSMVGHDRQYRHNTGWVYACIRAIAQRIAGQPVRLARRKQGAQGGASVGRLTAKSPTLRQLPKGLQEVQSNLELIESHPLLTAVDDPNPLMVRWTLLFVTAASLELTGKAYWWLFNDRRDRAGRWTILPLPASWVRPKHGERDLFAAWEIQVAEGVQSIEVPAEEIAYLYYPDPANPLAALSPLQANARAVVADEAMAEAQRRSFAQGPWPGLAITMARNVGPQGTEGTRPILTAEQRAQILGAVKAAYAGVAAFDEPIILDGLIERVDRLSNSPREMDFTNSGKYTKSRITQGFGINPIVLGEIEGANRASAAAADDNFCQHTINPKLELLSQCLTAWVGPLFAADGESLMVWLEPAVASDPDLAMNEERVLMGYGGIKINELRQRHNLGPVKGGEFAWVPATLVPVDLDDPQGPVAAHESAAAAGGAGAGGGDPLAQDGQGDGQNGQQDSQGQEGVPVPDEEVRAGHAGRFRYPG